MREHRKKVHGKVRKECPEYGIVVSNLERHRQSHLPENVKRLKCSQCRRGFGSPSNLSEHYKAIHSEERPFVCKFLCGYAC